MTPEIPARTIFVPGKPPARTAPTRTSQDRTSHSRTAGGVIRLPLLCAAFVAAVAMTTPHPAAGLQQQQQSSSPGRVAVPPPASRFGSRSWQDEENPAAANDSPVPFFERFRFPKPKPVQGHWPLNLSNMGRAARSSARAGKSASQTGSPSDSSIADAQAGPAQTGNPFDAYQAGFAAGLNAQANSLANRDTSGADLLREPAGFPDPASQRGWPDAQANPTVQLAAYQDQLPTPQSTLPSPQSPPWGNSMLPHDAASMQMTDPTSAVSQPTPTTYQNQGPPGFGYPDSPESALQQLSARQTGMAQDSLGVNLGHFQQPPAMFGQQLHVTPVTATEHALRLKEENSLLHEEIRRLNTVQNDLQQRLESAQREMVQAEQRIASLQAEIGNHMARQSQMQMEQEQLKREKDAMTEQSRMLVAAVEQTLDEIMLNMLARPQDPSSTPSR